MSASNNPTIDNKMIHRLVIQAYGPNPESACQLLAKCPLTKDQMNSIQTILQNTSNLTQEGMEKEIASLLAGRVTPQNENTSRTNALPSAAPQTVINVPTEPFLDLTEVVPKDILSFTFSFCDPKRELSALSCTSKVLNQMIPGVYSQQLSMKKSLTKDEIDLYQKRLGGKLNDWDCVFKHCKQLQALNFAWAFRQKGSDQEPRELALILTSAKQHCPSITNLNFVHCYDVNDQTLALLGRQFPNLTHLNLESCKCTTAGIQSLVTGCTNLISLNLSDQCAGHEEILLVANNCPKLCELILAGCGDYPASLTDASITVLAEKCASLTRLVISDPGITDASLEALAKHCKKLTFLCMDFCTNITKNGVAALQKQLPNLAIASNH